MYFTCSNVFSKKHVSCYLTSELWFAACLLCFSGNCCWGQGRPFGNRLQPWADKNICHQIETKTGRLCCLSPFNNFSLSKSLGQSWWSDSKWPHQKRLGWPWPKGQNRFNQDEWVRRPDRDRICPWQCDGPDWRLHGRAGLRGEAWPAGRRRHRHLSVCCRLHRALVPLRPEKRSSQGPGVRLQHVRGLRRWPRWQSREQSSRSAQNRSRGSSFRGGQLPRGVWKKQKHQLDQMRFQTPSQGSTIICCWDEFHLYIWY